MKKISTHNQLLKYQEEISHFKRVGSVLAEIHATWIKYFEEHNSHLVGKARTGLLKLRMHYLQHDLVDKNIIFKQGEGNQPVVKEEFTKEQYEKAHNEFLSSPITINVL